MHGSPSPCGLPSRLRRPCPCSLPSSWWSRAVRRPPRRHRGGACRGPGRGLRAGAAAGRRGSARQARRRAPRSRRRSCRWARPSGPGRRRPAAASSSSGSITGGAKPEKLVGTAVKAKATKAVTVATANAWMSKVGKGQARAAAALASAAAACPNQQIVLAGYSQGATALHRSLASFQSAYGARLMGAILVGDADKVRGTNATIVGAPAASAPRPRHRHPAARQHRRRARQRDRHARDQRLLQGRRGLRPARQPRGQGRREAPRLRLRRRRRRRGVGRREHVVAGRELGARLGDHRPRPAQPAVQPPAHRRRRPRLRRSSSGRRSAVCPPGRPSAPPACSPAPGRPRRRARPSATRSGPPTRRRRYSYGSFVLSAANPEPMVSSGGQSTCEVRSDTSLYCWGNAAYGQVGDGQTKDRIVPQVVGTLGWASVSASGSTACGIRLDQTLWCWGMNHRGQLGIGDAPRQLAPVQVAPGTLWSQVATGWLNTCAVGVDSSLWCWGDNSRGQVGVGDTRTRYTPDARQPLGMVVGDHRRLLRVRHQDRRHRAAAGARTPSASSAPGRPPTAACRLPWPVAWAGSGSTPAGPRPAASAPLGTAYCWGLNDARPGGLERPQHRDPSRGPGRRHLAVGDRGRQLRVRRHDQLRGDLLGQQPLRPARQRAGEPPRWRAEGQRHLGQRRRRLVLGLRASGRRRLGRLLGQQRARPARPRRPDQPQHAHAAWSAAGPSRSRERRDPDEFVATSFNILGSQHTEPGGGVPEWAPGRLRSRSGPPT